MKRKKIEVKLKNCPKQSSRCSESFSSSEDCGTIRVSHEVISACWETNNNINQIELFSIIKMDDDGKKKLLESGETSMITRHE